MSLIISSIKNNIIRDIKLVYEKIINPTTDDNYNEIIPGLYLGNYDAAMSKTFIIDKDINSGNIDRWYKSSVYNYSNNNIVGFDALKSFTTAGKFSQYIGIKRCAIYKTCREYQERLNGKLKYIING